MKKTLVVFSIICFLITNVISIAEENPKSKKGFFNMFSKPFISVDGGVSLWTADTGGMNKEAGVQNTGNDDGSSEMFGINIGTRIDKTQISLGLLRIGEFSSITQGVEGPALDPEKYNIFADTKTTAGLLSLSYDFVSLDKITMSLLGGVGVAGIDLKATDSVWESEYDESDFFWQLGAGVEYKISSAISLGLLYNYSDFGTVETGLIFIDNPEIIGDAGSFSSDYTTHNFKISLKYNF